jgi:hypothetical protein
MILLFDVTIVTTKSKKSVLERWGWRGFAWWSTSWSTSARRGGMLGA